MAETPPPLPRAQWPPAKQPALWREFVRETESDFEQTELVGLGGWLIFLTISFVVAIPNLAYHLVVKWRVFFARPHAWHTLTTPGSHAYHPLWSTVIIYETAGNALQLLCAVGLAILFFQRRKIFKPLMIAFQIASVLYLWLDHYLAQQVVATNAGHTTQLIGQTLGTLLWASYLLLSKRVRYTFVR